MSAPLAQRMRPQTLEDMIGQPHLLSKGAALRNVLEQENIPNLIFYGPPGTGKTTLAGIIAKNTHKQLYKLNGTSMSTADIKEVVANLDSLAAMNGTLLYIDEIQYLNKKQQQVLLQHIENGDITLIAATTENPYFYVYPAVLSRCFVFEFKAVTIDDAVLAVNRAFDFLHKERGEEYTVEAGVAEHLALVSGGDVRRAINSAEMAALSAMGDEDNPQRKNISLENVKKLFDKSPIRYDREGDEHYDLLSAFQKSMRGSDPDAALHYLARILEAGDLPSAARRLMVTAAEDVGLAYPMIIPIVKAAVDMAFQVGLPEARIPLADAVVLVCNSPKSNSAYLAIDAAIGDLRSGKSGPVPRQLQNKHFDGEDAKVKGQFYKYPHSFENHWVRQQYLPDALKGVKYYSYGDNKTEQAAREYWEKIKGKH